jgi:RNA polymerase sigma-70 factor (ECF subfamily)
MTQPNVTSLSLLERIRHGDEAGWRRVVDLYSPLIYHWCRRWGVEGADADDVLQDVFQAASQRVATFRRDQAGDTFRGWLRGITHHKVLDCWRARQQGPQAAGGSDAWQRLQQHPDHERDLPPDAAEAEQTTTLFHRALEMLRGEFEPQTWQAFWRTTVDEQSSVAVAAELGMTANAVRAAKCRVLRRLREELGDLVEETAAADQGPV